MWSAVGNAAAGRFNALLALGGCIGWRRNALTAEPICARDGDWPPRVQKSPEHAFRPSRTSPQGVTPISQLLHEVLKGKGRLGSHEKPPDYQVAYEFHILTTIEDKPGLPQLAPKKINRGQVWALDGRSIPSGKYQLQAEGGEIVQIRNWGTVWTILAS
jgi:hypothetical protein